MLLLQWVYPSLVDGLPLVSHLYYMYCIHFITIIEATEASQ